MKNTLVLFKNSAEEIPVKHLESISDAFSIGNIFFSQVEILSSNDEAGFKKCLERNKSIVDNLFILKRNDIKFDICSVVASVINIPFCENERAKEQLDKFSKINNKQYSEENAVIPIDTTFIPNDVEPFNAFMFEDGTFSLIYLPDREDMLSTIIQNFIVKYFENKYDLKREVFTVKYFGDIDKVYYTLNEISKKYTFVKYTVDVMNKDALIKLIFDGSIAKRDYDEVVRLFVLRLKDGIYAEFDTTLSERLFDLLKLRKVKIATAESFTGGRVVSSIIANNGASNFVHEGIVCYSNKSKIKRVGVIKEDIEKLSAVSSKVAYEMALGLLREGDCDIAIATTGYAGPKQENSDEPIGLFYIGIGMKDGVDVYRYHESGNREEITETAKNTALFLAIKKLKNI